MLCAVIFVASSDLAPTFERRAWRSRPAFPSLSSWAVEEMEGYVEAVIVAVAVRHFYRLWVTGPGALFSLWLLAGALLLA